MLSDEERWLELAQEQITYEHGLKVPPSWREFLETTRRLARQASAAGEDPKPLLRLAYNVRGASRDTWVESHVVVESLRLRTRPKRGRVEKSDRQVLLERKVHQAIIELKQKGVEPTFREVHKLVRGRTQDVQKIWKRQLLKSAKHKAK
jgi:hypothetical protein